MTSMVIRWRMRLESHTWETGRKERERRKGKRCEEVYL